MNESIKKLTLFLLALASIISLIFVWLYGWTDKAGIYIGVGYFILSLVSLYYSTKEEITKSTLFQKFEDLIVGSVGVGLNTIKKLQDHPPSEIAKTTSSKFQFIGVAGTKFLKDVFEQNDFFKTNREASNVQIILMDPFSDDMLSLDGNNKQIRKDIVKSLQYLYELEKNGFKFQVRLYPRVPPLRLMICDGKAVAMSMYTPDVNGWQNAQLIFKKESDQKDTSLAPHFASLFIDMWDKSLSFTLGIRCCALEALLYENRRTHICCPNSNESIPEIGMVHGRFQPLHHEHLEYILWGINNSKKCLIGITQPNIDALSETEGDKHRMEKAGNPYSYDERKRMIELSLEKLNISKDRYEIVKFDVDNIHDALQNFPYPSKDITQFMKIFSDWEKYKKDLFIENEFKIFVIHREIGEKIKKHVTGTLVRELIRTKRNWKDYVPAGVEEFLEMKDKYDFK